VENGLMKD
jgi:endoglycosylceramidase